MSQLKRALVLNDDWRFFYRTIIALIAGAFVGIVVGVSAYRRDGDDEVIQLLRFLIIFFVVVLGARFAHWLWSLTVEEGDDGTGD